MQKQILVAAVLAALTLPAMASGVYLVGDIGQGKIEADAGNDFTLSKTDTTYSIGAGFDINQFAAIEIAYRDLGSISDSYTYSIGVNDYNFSSETSATAFQASVVGKLPISDVFSVFGRLGVAKIEVDSDYNDDGDRWSNSESKTKGLFGVGVSYNITPEFAVRAEYSQYAKWDDTKLSALTVGATYSF